MENFMKMLSTQAILLVYMAVGFYCRKRGIIEKKMQGKLTDFVLRITLPCMIFNSFSMHITLDMLKQAALCLGVAFFICFAAWLGGKVVYNMYPKEKKSVLQYATLVNNAAFLGLPIVKAVLGEAGMFLASIFIIPNRIFMWTAGVSIFTAEADKKAAFKKVMLNRTFQKLHRLYSVGISGKVYHRTWKLYNSAVHGPDRDDDDGTDAGVL